MDEVEVVVAHSDATIRVGDVFLKVDADQSRIDGHGFDPTAGL